MTIMNKANNNARPRNMKRIKVPPGTHPLPDVGLLPPGCWMGMRQASAARRKLTSCFSVLQVVPLKLSHFKVLQSGQKRSVKITEEPRHRDRPASETRLSASASRRLLT